jgi:hypothetical protein
MFRATDIDSPKNRVLGCAAFSFAIVIIKIVPRRSRSCAGAAQERSHIASGVRLFMKV